MDKFIDRGVVMKTRNNNKSPRRSDQLGAALQEYVLTICLIACVSIPTLYVVRDGVKSIYSEAADGGGTWEVNNGGEGPTNFIGGGRENPNPNPNPTPLPEND